MAQLPFCGKGAIIIIFRSMPESLIQGSDLAMKTGLVLEGGVITDYPMGFARYRKIKAEQPAKKSEPEKTVKEKSLTEKPPRGNKNQQAARRQLTICETGISKLEERCRQLDAEMEQNACDATTRTRPTSWRPPSRTRRRSWRRTPATMRNTARSTPKRRRRSRSSQS